MMTDVATYWTVLDRISLVGRHDSPARDVICVRKVYEMHSSASRVELEVFEKKLSSRHRSCFGRIFGRSNSRVSLHDNMDSTYRE
jgi:hypothetical protein